MQQQYTIYELLTKREVEMAGYWPSSFLACLWTETESRSINSEKEKNEAIIQLSWLKKLGQQLRIHYLAFGEIFSWDMVG